MSHDAPDGTYARRVQDGDRSAFQVLLKRYEGMVFDLAHQYADDPEAAEDLAQDVFLTAYRRIDDLQKPDRFASWLYGIALNRGRDHAKNVRRDTHPFSRSEQAETAIRDNGAATPDDQIVANERGDQLWDALDKLSSTYATPFLLKYRDGLTYKAMSKRLDISVSALKVRVHRARKKLQTLLAPRHEESRS